jgi:hypothetical protein
MEPAKGGKPRGATARRNQRTGAELRGPNPAAFSRAGPRRPKRVPHATQPLNSSPLGAEPPIGGCRMGRAGAGSRSSHFSPALQGTKSHQKQSPPCASCPPRRGAGAFLFVAAAAQRASEGRQKEGAGEFPPAPLLSARAAGRHSPNRSPSSATATPHRNSLPEPAERRLRRRPSAATNPAGKPTATRPES